MTLLRPCRGVIQLFTLEAGEITTGEMQQIAIEGNHACAVAGQRFVHQVIVVLIARARVQAHHAIGIPAAVTHKATQEVVAPGDAVDGIGLRCSQHLLDGLLQFRGNTLVGVDHQDIVASGKLLRALALAVQSGELNVAPKKVISVAEVLDPQDRALLAQVFPAVGEVYQATEGFLAATCAHGVLHLNEAFIVVEKAWLDDRRFIPVITDFTRTTQPIVRYRLDDVLVARDAPCPCGDPSQALAHIEGRQDDQLLLPDGQGGQRVIFGDLCNRALARVLPLTADFRLIQHGEAHLTLIAQADDAQRSAAQAALTALFEQQGVACGLLRWTHHASLPPATPGAKRRRILRVRETA